MLFGSFYVSYLIFSPTFYLLLLEMTLEGVSFWPFYSINDLKSAFGKLSPNKKIVSFQQILKVGENIKIDICKCPINVELVKKSSHRPGTLQMPFQIHLHLSADTKLIVLFWFYFLVFTFNWKIYLTISIK